MLLLKNVLSYRIVLFVKGLRAAFDIRLSNHDVKAMLLMVLLFVILLGAKRNNPTGKNMLSSTFNMQKP